ncbi:GntR family transcriptional regulator [Streptomyces sp. NPDC050560]|uniref:GntR family transcriptional regulator n=1 Tax=Streptomyces sp. NPDC050560 TaxID=3365630 RepID=UPI00379CA182
MVVTQENLAVTDSSRFTPQSIADRLRERIRAGVLKPGEPLPTQAVLAAEFGVERGVVREAVRQLRADGLLVGEGKGRSPHVAGPSAGGGRDEPQPTMVGLAHRLSEAFRAPHVRVDAVCLTAETLMLAVGEPVRRIHEGLLRPESVEVRVLLPSRDISLAFPAPAEAPEEQGRVHQRWLTQRNAQGQVLRHNLRSLRGSHGIDVKVTFRALPFTPPMKLYLLGGDEALFAYYLVTRRAEEYGSGTLDMWDALGGESLLFSFQRGGGERDAAFVEESQKWFDALWATITTDLTLS